MSENQNAQNASGWTGGQYSLFRALLAVQTACVLGARLLQSAADRPWLAGVLLLGLLACLPLAFGARDRFATIFLILAVGGGAALADGVPLLLPTVEVVVTTILLGLHLFVPPAPFGSRDAADRVDPRGEWKRPAWLGHSAWGLVAAAHFLRAAAGIEPNSFLQETMGLSIPGLTLAVMVFQGGLFLIGLIPRLRPAAWVALVLFRIACLTAFGTLPGDGSLLLLLLFACEPIWFRGRALHLLDGAATKGQSEPASNGPARLYYDGDCGFCHGSIRFILSEEDATPNALRLRFAPLASEGFADRIATEAGLRASEIPDSIVLDLEDGRLLTQSAAALEIASRLGGIWLGIALIARPIPSSILDLAYDAFARIRKRLFAAPKGACPILPPMMRVRFDL